MPQTDVKPCLLTCAPQSPIHLFPSIQPDCTSIPPFILHHPTSPHPATPSAQNTLDTLTPISPSPLTTHHSRTAHMYLTSPYLTSPIHSASPSPHSHNDSTAASRLIHPRTKKKPRPRPRPPSIHTPQPPPQRTQTISPRAPDPAKNHKKAPHKTQADEKKKINHPLDPSQVAALSPSAPAKPSRPNIRPTLELPPPTTW
ncbi:hypothetical protein K505DRAFT_330396 [Melanomma pulvis-pyrius CBS 109.77]|uniref:Uncharacterized protein n=1 Tax=Melanomma pulvis-pyrius CBS 109.77 TaxID=1314802 RepID=A0A6A6WRE1_9PLEO|nr:hypothetical protein K505DRAFT_330396 [Melanomma pulvis-pyrius CBS 109.77]